MSFPRSVQAYVAIVSTLALAAVVASWNSSRDWITIVSLSLLLILLSSLGARAKTSSVNMSTSFVIALAAVFLVGFPGAGIVALSHGFEWARNRAMLKRVFNAAQFSLSASLVALMLQGLAGRDPLSTASLWELIALTALCAVTFWACNIGMVTGVIALAERTSFLRVWWGEMSWVTLSYVVYGIFSMLLAVLWHISIVAGLLMLMPLLVARWTFAQYAAEKDAYDATVAAVVQAVETKDHYTRGHSERVSKGGVMIARQHGMREDRVALVRYAGLMHDVGKIGVPTRVLQKQGRLTPEEFEAITTHPLRGFEMLRDIGFLREAQSAIVHHHERIDGRGYPMGLKGDQIPDLARLISVADAFDSMTSTRSYRAARPVEAAIEELERCKGTQFDPVFVDDFVAALRRDGWVAQAEDFTGPDEGADAGHAGEGSDQVTISDPRDTNITLLRGPRFALDEAAS